MTAKGGLGMLKNSIDHQSWSNFHRLHFLHLVLGQLLHMCLLLCLLPLLALLLSQLLQSPLFDQLFQSPLVLGPTSSVYSVV